jgi:hypothetical protein
MSGFPNWPNPMDPVRRNAPTGATSGRIFRHMYDDVGCSSTHFFNWRSDYRSDRKSP